MSECEARFAQISMLIDGELREDEAEALRAHLARCPECAAVYAALSGVGEALTEDVPAQLHAKIMDGVDRASRAQRAQRRFRILRPTLTAAACLVVIVGTILFTGNLMRQSKSAPESAVMGVSSSAASVPAAPAEFRAESAADAGTTAETAGGSLFSDAAGEAAEDTFAAPEAPAAPPEATGDWLKSSQMAVNAANLTGFTALVQEKRDGGALLVKVSEPGLSGLDAGEEYLVIPAEEQEERVSPEPGALIRVTLAEQTPEAEETGDPPALKAKHIEIIEES